MDLNIERCGVSMKISREEAWQALNRDVQSTVLLKHCLAVEIAMRAYAEKFGEDQEYWGVVGLLHDIDFEQYPEEHPQHVRDFLKKHGWNDEELVTNIESHARDWALERTMLQKTLLAVDELTGFIIACALVRPDKSLDKLEVKSVMKKMKDKAFAKAVNRETILTSAADMQVDIQEHIEFVKTALANAVKQPQYQMLSLAG